MNKKKEQGTGFSSVACSLINHSITSDVTNVNTDNSNIQNIGKLYYMHR